MRRRQFIRFVGGAIAAWPFASRAQQTAMPVIGYLGVRSPAADATFIAAFHEGLNEAGFTDGKNVTIEFRSAQNNYGRLPALAAELVQRRVNVIVATSTPAALVAKAATETIPIVFETGSDPVNIGLVSSLNQPGGNVTGVTQMNIIITPKRLELLHELIPSAKVVALLVDPANPTIAAAQSSGVGSAAQSLGLELHVLTATTDRDKQTSLVAAQMSAFDPKRTLARPPRAMPTRESGPYCGYFVCMLYKQTYGPSRR